MGVSSPGKGSESSKRVKLFSTLSFCLSSNDGDASWGGRGWPAERKWKTGHPEWLIANNRQKCDQREGKWEKTWESRMGGWHTKSIRGLDMVAVHCLLWAFVPLWFERKVWEASAARKRWTWWGAMGYQTWGQIWGFLPWPRCVPGQVPWIPALDMEQKPESRPAPSRHTVWLIPLLWEGLPPKGLCMGEGEHQGDSSEHIRERKRFSKNRGKYTWARNTQAKPACRNFSQQRSSAGPQDTENDYLFPPIPGWFMTNTIPEREEASWFVICHGSLGVLGHNFLRKPSWERVGYLTWKITFWKKSI